jgi:hypothetical protein
MYSFHSRISSWLRTPLRSSGPSKTGGVGWLTRKWTRPSGVRTGRSQCDFEDRRSCDHTSGAIPVLPVFGSTGDFAPGIALHFSIWKLRIARRRSDTRQHQHAVLARVRPKPQASLPAADLAVVVEVHAAGHAGVHRREVASSVADRRLAVLRHFQVLVLEQVGRFAAAS